jgi:flavin-dependent dehydrogenase
MIDRDVVIIGGGLAGLSAGILFAREGYSVTVLERDEYPRHKVCGEYVGKESLPFLKQIGLELDDPSYPQIHKLQVSDGRGRMMKASLDLGGVGISRWALDAKLATLANEAGAELATRCKAELVDYDGELLVVKSAEATYRARLVLGAWGKRSNLDVKLARPHVRGDDPKLDGWIGVKYHIQTDHPADVIALHNFEGGYCGISRVEEGRVCLCYLVQGEALRDAENSIELLESSVLRKNPHLDRIWRESLFLFDKPIAISQVSFQKRSAAADGVLFLGDAAGLIAPLCGNGMSMAFRAAQQAFLSAGPFLKGAVSRAQMEADYSRGWSARFSRRLLAGRLLQARFGNEQLTSGLISVLRIAPFLKRPLIRATHGKPF